VSQPPKQPLTFAHPYEVRRILIRSVHKNPVTAVRITYDLRTVARPRWHRIARKGVAFCCPGDEYLEHVGLREAVRHALQHELPGIRVKVWEVAVRAMKGLGPEAPATFQDLQRATVPGLSPGLQPGVPITEKMVRAAVVPEEKPASKTAGS